LRFIEQMPFSGLNRKKKPANSNLLQRLSRIFLAMEELPSRGPSTARVFKPAGYKGSLGIIQGYSRLFCASCNKVRITPIGMLKTCLYDNGVLDLKGMLRQGAEDDAISAAIIACIRNRCLNGHEAESRAKRCTEPSMASIGG